LALRLRFRQAEQHSENRKSMSLLLEQPNPPCCLLSHLIQPD
jgi:hypothetical protein